MSDNVFDYYDEYQDWEQFDKDLLKENKMTYKTISLKVIIEKMEDYFDKLKNHCDSNITLILIEKFEEDILPSLEKVMQEQEEHKALIKRIRETSKKLLLKNYEMRKLLLKHGVDFEGGFQKLLNAIKNEN